MNETIRIIKGRNSLRQFSGKPISLEHLDVILDCALKAPTGGEFYSIIVVRETDKKNKLVGICENQGFVATASVILLFIADMQRSFDYYEYCSVRDYCKENNFEYRGPDKFYFKYALDDALLAAENAVVAAESLGIGSCFMGGVNENVQTLKEMFNLPEWTYPAALLCLGYYPENVNLVPRKRIDKKYMVFHEGYHRLKDSELKDVFLEREKNFKGDKETGAKNLGQLLYYIRTFIYGAKVKPMSEEFDKWSGKTL